MRKGLRIGNIYGMSIHADWSWILVLTMIAWALGAAVFPELYPQWDLALRWGAAIAASLLFLISVLVHELAHSLAARASRITIREIALFPFGGIPNISRTSTTPTDELVMAVVGPATSLLLGAILFWLGMVRATALKQIVDDTPPALVELDPVAMLLLWLGVINLLLGSLNLIPGFPLDGGRVLRSILWVMTKNRRRATQWASSAGHLTAWGLVAAGVLIVVSARPPFFGVASLGGFWLSFFGWFLNRAAVQIDHQVALQDLLAIVQGAQFMTTRVPTVPPNIPLSSLMDDYVMGSSNPALPVVDNDHLVGLICVRDVCKVPREKWETTEIGEVMTAPSHLAIARPDEAGRDALEQLAHACETAARVAGYSVGQENG